jgi:hypothetical protein
VPPLLLNLWLLIISGGLGISFREELDMLSAAAAAAFAGAVTASAAWVAPPLLLTRA